jgi:hypothetical protein
MLHIKTDETFWNYSGKENFLVLPITTHVRKDGGLVFVREEAKEAAEKFPDLQKVWGYFIKSGVQTPTYRRSNINLIGAIERKHYASNPDEEVVEQSLYLLKETSDNNPGYLFYLQQPLGGDDFYELNKRVLSTDRFILLERVPHVEV